MHIQRQPSRGRRKGFTYVSLFPAMKTPYAKQLETWRKRRQRAAELQAKGFSLAKIGAQLGCTKQRVHQLLKNHAAQVAA